MRRGAREFGYTCLTSRLSGIEPAAHSLPKPLYEPAKLRNSIDVVRKHAEQAGRDPDKISFAYSAGWNDLSAEQVSPDGSRLVLTGSADAVASDIHAFSQMGVTEMTLGFPGTTLEERMERMSHFATEVMPLTS